MSWDIVEQSKTTAAMDAQVQKVGKDLPPPGSIDLNRDPDLSVDFEPDCDFECDLRLYLEPDFEPDIRLEDLELALDQQGLSPKRGLSVFGTTALIESETHSSQNEADTTSMFTAAVKVESCPDLEEELWKKVEGCHIASSQFACGKKDKQSCNISGFSEFIRKTNKAMNSKKSFDVEDESCSSNQYDIASDTADIISINDDEDENVFGGKGQSGYIEGGDCCCGEDKGREGTNTSEEDKEGIDSENGARYDKGFYGGEKSEGGKVIEDLRSDYECQDGQDASRDEKDNEGSRDEKDNEEIDNAGLDGEDTIGGSKSNEQELLVRSQKEITAPLQNMSAKADDLNAGTGWIESNQKEIRCEMNHLRVEQAELRAERADLRAERAYWRVEREQLRSEYRQFKGEKELHLADREQLMAEQNQLRVGQEQLKAEQEQLRLEQEQLRLKQEQLRLEQEQLRIEQEQLRTARMETSAEQEKLKAQKEQMRTEQNINRTEQSPTSTEQKPPKDDEEVLRAGQEEPVGLQLVEKKVKRNRQRKTRNKSQNKSKHTASTSDLSNFKFITEQKPPKDDEKVLRTGQEEPVGLQLVKKEEKRGRQRKTRNKKNQNESKDTASTSALSTHFSTFRTDLPTMDHKIPTSETSHTHVPMRDWQKFGMKTRPAKKHTRNQCSCQKNDKKTPAGLVKEEMKRRQKNNRNEVMIKIEPTDSTKNQNRNHDELTAFTSAVSTSSSNFPSEPPTKKRKIFTSRASRTSLPIRDWSKCGMTTRLATKCKRNDEKQSVTEQKWPKDDTKDDKELLSAVKEEPVGLQLIEEKEKRNRQKNTRNKKNRRKSKHTASTSDLSTRNQNKNGHNLTAFSSALPASSSAFRSDLPAKKNKISTPRSLPTSVLIQDWPKCGMTTRSATRLKNGESWQKNYLDYLDKYHKSVR